MENISSVTSFINAINLYNDTSQKQLTSYPNYIQINHLI